MTKKRGELHGVVPMLVVFNDQPDEDRPQSGGPGLVQRSLHLRELFLSNLSSGKAKLEDLKRVL